MAKITVDQLEGNGSLGDVMEVIEDREVDILLINQGLNTEGQFEISLLLKEEEAVRVSELFRERLGGCGNLSMKLGLGMVSAIGIGIRSNRLQGRVVKVLNNEGMRVEMISSSETSLSYVVACAHKYRWILRPGIRNQDRQPLRHPWHLSGCIR